MNSPTKSLEISRRIAKITAYLSPIFSAVIAAGYFFALKFDFDYDIGHFERSSPLFIITATAIALGIALPALAAILSRKKASITELPEPAGIIPFFAVFAAVLALFESGTTLMAIARHALGGKLELAAAATLPLLSVGLVTIAIPKLGRSLLAQISVTASIVSMDLYILARYFDQTLPQNSPVRHITMLAELSVMLFLISEARLTFGVTEQDGRPTARRALLPLYIFANNTCATVGLGFSAGALVFEIFTENTSNLHSLLRLAMYAAIGAVAMCRAFTARRLISEYNPSPIERPKEKEKKSTPEINENN